jgi:hypothetical protein
MEEEVLMTVFSIVFTAVELILAGLFIYRAWLSVQLFRAGREMFPETAEKLRNRAVLGGALAVVHLFIAFILVRPYLGFLPDTRWLLLAIWPVNSAVSLWAYWRTG